MSEKPDDPKQNPPDDWQKTPYPSRSQPIEDIMLQKGYPLPIVKNYAKLIPKDIQLAELYRLTAKDSPALKKVINPIQARVDTKGRIWVDVIFERKKGVKIQDLKKIMRVHGSSRQTLIVTGRIKLDNVPDLEKMAVQLQVARPVRSTLDESRASIFADNQILSGGGFGNIDGSGVIIGIVDKGCDFKHPNFKKADKKTRLLFLWDQDGKIGPGKKHPDNYSYGVEYSENQINDALKLSGDKPYDKLEYWPEDGAHGTYVMDIAAGSSADPKYKGVAPGANLIFVHFGKPGSNTTDEIADKVTELGTLGSSICLCDAVKYIFKKADKADKGKKMPVVINISLGSSGGAHDGSSLVEKMFDDMLKSSGRAIVIAAGNDYQKKNHASGKVSPNTETDLHWFIHRIEDPKPWQLRQELEIWYPKDSSLKVEIIDPNNHSYGECNLGDAPRASDDEDIPLVLIKHMTPEAELSKSMNHIDILVDNSKEDFITGEWIVRLKQEEPQTTQARGIEFQAWIERNGQDDRDSLSRKIGSEFSKDSQKEGTINGLANAVLPIVVGSCVIEEPELPLAASYFSGAGPTFNKTKPNIAKPELCAPGENISSAEALTDGRYPHNGTSVAAPHVTGVIALMFQKARLNPQKPKLLSINKIRKVLKISAVPIKNGGGVKHDNQLGFGLVNALKALEELN